MKMVLTSATDPDGHIACLSGWPQRCAQALRSVVRHAAPELEERLKWGHLVCFAQGPVLLIRAEPTRVLFGFWEGQRLRHIEPRLRPGGKFQMATLELKEDPPLRQETAVRLGHGGRETRPCGGRCTVHGLLFTDASRRCKTRPRGVRQKLQRATGP